MQTEHAGEDASLDSAVQAIMQKMPSKVEARQDTRENRTDRDITERDTSTDLEEQERIEREEARAQQQGEEPGDAEGEEATEAGADDDAYIELPSAEEGKAPERVPVKEAMEAVQKLRQMDGDVAKAIIRIETEAQQKSDTYLNEVIQMHTQVKQMAEAAMQAMPLPRQPSRDMLDSRSPNYDPELYHRLMLDFEDGVKVYRNVQEVAKRAAEAQTRTQEQAEQANIVRENERLQRYLPEWGDEASRLKIAQDLETGLQKHFGIPAEVMNQVPFHHSIVLLARAAIAAKEAPVKQAEVKKQLQERAPRVVRGSVTPDRDKGTGRFISEARKDLRESGSEDAFARLLLKSGALRGV